jgi:hypothetical protein
MLHLQPVPPYICDMILLKQSTLIFSKRQVETLIMTILLSMTIVTFIRWNHIGGT